MTRLQTRRLVWNGVIYGMAFATAMMVTALLQPPQDLRAPMTASIDEPVSETTPARSVAEVVIP
jgi:hypothetical protein